MKLKRVPLSLSSLLPSMDATAHLGGSQIATVVCRPRFLRIHTTTQKGKNLTFAMLGSSTASKVQILLSLDLAIMLLGKISKIKKSKSGPVPGKIVIETGLRSAIKSGHADIVVPANALDNLRVLDDANVNAFVEMGKASIAASSVASSTPGSFRVALTVAEEIHLDVGAFTPKKVKALGFVSQASVEKPRRRPASKTAN